MGHARRAFITLAKRAIARNFYAPASSGAADPAAPREHRPGRTANGVVRRRPRFVADTPNEIMYNNALLFCRPIFCWPHLKCKTDGRRSRRVAENENDNKKSGKKKTEKKTNEEKQGKREIRVSAATGQTPAPCRERKRNQEMDASGA